MAKFFLKKIDGVDDLVKVANKPIWGKIPDFYRNVDWNIDNNWYRCNGTDILNSIDPFGDQSLVRKFMFDGNYVDKVSGTVTAVPGGTHNHFQKSGPFDTKCLTIEDAESGVNSINCGSLSRLSTQTGFTISGWVKILDTVSMVAKRPSVDPLAIMVWGFRDIKTGSYYNAESPEIYYYPAIGKFGLEMTNDSIVSGVATNPTTLSYLSFTAPIGGDWVHLTQVIQKSSIKFFINGVLIATTTGSYSDQKLLDGTLVLGDSSYGTNASYKQVEVYKRDLSPTEVKALYNQQLFNEVICDGSNPTYKPFTYLTEKEKLLRVVTDESGNIVKYELVKKPGYIASTDNVVKYENGQLLDRYGKNVLSGSLNRLMHFSSNTSVNVTASSIWATFLTADIELNTDKYDYVFMLNTSVRVLQAGNLNVCGGGSINLSIGNTPITTTAHRGYLNFATGIAPMDSHETVQLISPLIDRGFKGKFRTRCSLARFMQDANVATVCIFNEAFQYAPSPFSKTTGLHLSTLTVYELNKASNDLV